MTITYDLGDIDSITQVMAQNLKGGDVLGLSGDLGAGKTTMVKSLASCWGINPNEVTSPTYVYHHIYPTSSGMDLHHIDLYRMTSKDMFWSLNLFDFIKPNDICCVEWINKFEGLFDSYLGMDIQISGERQRALDLKPHNWDVLRLETMMAQMT